MTGNKIRVLDSMKANPKRRVASKTRKDATVLEVQTRINTMIEKCVGRYAALVDRNLASTQVSSLDAH